MLDLKKKYRKLLEFANDAVFVAEVETGNIVEANQKASELVGRPLSEIIGMHQTMLHPPDLVDQYQERFKTRAAEGIGDTAEMVVRHAGGHDVPVEVSFGMLEVDGQRFMQGIFRDLTERNRAKELRDNLNEINSVLNSNLKITEVMDRVMSGAATTVGADSAAFFLDDGDQWILEKVHGQSPHKPGTRLSREMLNLPPRMVEDPSPVLITDARNDDRANKEMARKMGILSLILVPLVSDKRALGLLVFRYFTKQSEFSDEERDFCVKLGAATSLALENARVFSEQQEIAKTLQEALLVVPEQLPGVEFGHLYRSAADAAMVGGDFYDVFSLQGNRIGIVIGDVSGKGLDAAALTSMLKHTIKGYAYEGHSPGAIVVKTNLLAMKDMEVSTFVTAVVGVLDTESGVLTYCCAGHPPPIIKRQNGDIDLLETGNLPMGVFDIAEPPSKQQLIGEGDVITFYTDGVIEARCEGEMFGESRLIDLLQNTKELSATETPQRVLDELMRCECTLSDDLAVVSFSLHNSPPVAG